MIEWIGAWLKEIIFVILMATFVDLLLPNNKMQRYVKLVISLFILLTLLSPVVKLLRSEADWQVIARAVEGTGQEAQPASASFRSESEVLSRGNEIERNTEAQVLGLTEIKLQDWIRGEILSRYQTEAEVEAKIVLTEANEPQAEWVRVKLMPTSKSPAEEETEGAIAKMEPIRPIEPVSIEIRADGSNRGPPESVSRETAALSQEETETKQQIEAWLEKELKLSPERIQVDYDKGGDPHGQAAEVD